MWKTTRRPALAEALGSGKIAGAALDCFANEAVLQADSQPLPLSQTAGVITAPHSIGWTYELFRDIGAVTCGHLVDMAKGIRPSRGIVNPEVFDRPGFVAKWNRIRGFTNI
jgi:phosphoglycerate dehydrogenase-like enzyme